MSLEILHDPRVRQVPWRDLCGLGRRETVRELLLALPWLLGSWWCAARGWYVPALGLSFVFFLVGLRVVHDAFHQNLGLGRRGHDAVLLALSGLMMSSMHAIRFNHLRHHKHCMDDEDVEARSARQPAWRALALGPAFPFLLHHAAWCKGSVRERCWMLAELGLCLALGVSAFTWLDLPFLHYHVAVMLVGQCLTAFFAVWTVHHDCDRSHFIARTVRGRLKSVLTFDMFYHVEHHLFPRVPTCRLPALAERLDRHAPELQQHRVF